MKTIKRLLTIFLAVLLACSAPAASFEAAAAPKMPELNAKVTEKNILKILDKYDKDGAYVFRSQMNAGKNVLGWFTGKRIIDDIDSAIHEITHGFSANQPYKTDYFVGNQKSIPVEHTLVCYTKYMAPTIPKRLRTFRYKTYISEPDPYLSANLDGVYGLLDEFMAYRMGMSTMTALYPYLVSQKANWSAWKVFVANCENNRLAYTEFKYYILHYLYFVKQRLPEVYQGIVDNRQFCKAYRRLENSFVKLIKTYEKDLKKLQKVMKRQGHVLEVNDRYVMYWQNEEEGIGITRFTADYEKLQKEIKKNKYSSIHRKLVSKGK